MVHHSSGRRRTLTRSGVYKQAIKPEAFPSGGGLQYHTLNKQKGTKPHDVTHSRSEQRGSME